MKNDNKTRANSGSVEAFLQTVSEQRRAESRQLIIMMRDISGKEPVMWGSSIIGFDSYHYKYPSGREGDWLRIGFSPRAAKLSLYITGDAAKYKTELDAMGKHSTGKGCIYITKLADVDLDKLAAIVRQAYEKGDYC